MRPRVATVLSALGWEESFVAHARRSGRIRIVGRAYRADEVVSHDPDVAVVGDETAWLTANVIGLWAAFGIRTVVVGHRRAVAHSGPVAHSSQAPADIAATVRDSWLTDPMPSDVISVVGPHGSGTTEVACALATTLAPVHVVDRDEPSVSLRLNVPASGVDGITITSGFPIDTPPQTLVDCGSRGPLPHGRCVLVVAHTPVSLVRAAKLIIDWTGPVPDLVVNMTRHDRHAADLAMASLGLEPQLLLPYDPDVAEAAALGEEPPRWFMGQVAALLNPTGGAPSR